MKYLYGYLTKHTLSRYRLYIGYVKYNVHAPEILPQPSRIRLMQLADASHTRSSARQDKNSRLIPPKPPIDRISHSLLRDKPQFMTDISAFGFKKTTQFQEK